MTGFSYQLVMALSLCCVPICWLAPRGLGFDLVAGWTLACLGLLYPLTAVWMLGVALALPLVLGRFGRHRGLVAVVLIAVLAGGLASERLAGASLVGASLAIAGVAPAAGRIGGAFFTLRALHVVIEWWMGRMPAPGLRDSLRYFFFLPVIAAGPINRLGHFQHQLRRQRWDTAGFMTGAERALWGAVLVWLIGGKFCAYLLVVAAGVTLDWPDFLQGWALSAMGWVTLYVVFSGSSHIALGLALMMGVTLEENFNRPWAAGSMVEFWRRWHMTLTGWVQDYVFRPVTALTRRPVLGLFAAMLVVGLWHAFSIYYILWSVWQSLGILLARHLARLKEPEMMPPVSEGSDGSTPAALRVGRGMIGLRLQGILGPLGVLAWLSAARPVIGLLGVAP